VKAGAFDTLETNRARAFAAIETMLRFAAQAADERSSNQVSLFGGASAPKLTVPTIPDWPLHEKLQHEFEAIGFYLSAHPLDAYAKALKRLGAIRSSELGARLAAGGGSRVTLAGTVIGKQERTSAKGNRFAFIQLSDAGGVFEMTVFSELLATSRDLLASGKPLLISADARIEEESIKLLAQTIRSLDDAAANAAAGLRVSINDLAALADLKTAIAAERKGRGRIAVLVDLGDEGEVEIGLPGAYAIAAHTRSKLATVPGVTEVVEL
jgi:DNA polymerase-3 subunit alpha